MSKYPDLTDKIVCPDTETNGLKWYEPGIKPFGIAISFDDQDHYFDFRRDPDSVKWLRDNINRAAKLVNHNMKFDMHMLRQVDVNVDPKLAECTQVRAALINEHLLKYDLDSLLKKYLGMEKVSDIYEELAKLFGGRATRNVQMPNLHKAPIDLVGRYAKGDSRGALELWRWQEAEIERQDLHSVWDLEKRLFPVIYSCEMRGIAVDEEGAHRAAEQITGAVENYMQELREVAGFEVNPNPSGSIHKLFDPKYSKTKGQWYANDGTPLPVTDAGKPSFGKETLQLMKHPAAELILKCRKLMKARDTFVNKHVLGHMHEGRVYPNINQTKSDNDGSVMGTGTGRLSYTDPAMQQIPARDKLIAAMIRPLFLPDPGQGWSYGDLDQHEYRIFAHYVNSPRIIKAYRENPNLDFHGNVAELTGLPRSAPEAGGPNAKQLNLGMVFTMGMGHMAALCGLPWEWDEFTTARGEVIRYQKAGPEGIELAEQYYAAVPGVREMAKKAKRVATTRGYVKTIHGRHIRFPGGFGARKASGLIYQGSAGDLNKENMIRIHEYLESESPDSHLLLNIHDEYSMSMEMDGREIEHLKEIRRLVEDKPYLRVPIRIDFTRPSKNWWEATEAEKVT